MRHSKKKAIEEAHQYFANGHYFMLTLSFADQSKDIMHDRIRDYSKWSEELKKMLFRMGEYIYLETAQHKEIPLGLYHFDRSYGYTKDRKMLLSFPKIFNEKDIISKDSQYVIMHIKEFGLGIGTQKLEWRVEELTKNK